MHAGTYGKAGCIQRNFLTPWFKQSRTRSNNHQKKPVHLPSKREAFPPLQWFKFLFLNQFFLFFLSLCLNRGNPLLLTGQQSWLSGWCVTQLSKCLCEQCVSREEVRGSPMWSRRDLKDVATSPPHCPAAFSSLAAWGMCFNQEPSPQPRSERCQSSLSLCHSTLLLLAVSLTHTETHPPRQSILSLTLFLPTLSCCADRSDHLPPFSGSWKSVLCVAVLYQHQFLQFFCSQSVFLNDTKDYLEENLKIKSSINSLLLAQSVARGIRHTRSGLWLQLITQMSLSGDFLFLFLEWGHSPTDQVELDNVCVCVCACMCLSQATPCGKMRERSNLNLMTTVQKATQSHYKRNSLLYKSRIETI